LGSAEDSAGEGSTPPGSPKKSARTGEEVQRYSAAALAVRQAPVTCLIPKRLWTLMVLGLLGLVGIAAIEVLYACALPRFSPDRRPVIAALDVEARGSLAAWYASLLLAAAAAGSLLVYSLRRHRLDDYRARYRVWLWAAGALLLGSADVVTGLHAGLGLLATDMVGDRLQVESQLWWIGIVSAMLGLAGLRLMIEMRACRSALASILLAAASYAAAVCVALGILPLDGDLLEAMSQSACLLLASLGLTGAVFAYARYVYREAQGETVPRVKAAARSAAPRRTPAAAARLKEKQPSRSLRVDAPHTPETSQKAATAPVEFHASPPASAETDDGDENQHLSRAERRRLRKQLRSKGASG